MPVGIIRLLNTEPISSDTNVLYLDNNNKLNFKKNNSSRGTIVANLQLDNINQIQKNEINTTSINLIDDLINKFTLVSANLTINNNIINKNSTVSDWVNYSVYSQESYTGSAYIKFKVLNLNSYFMVGLSSSPTNNLSYNDTEFQIYISDNTSSNDNASRLVFHKGTQIGDWGTVVNLNDIFEILYDGKTVNYFHNGESFYNFSGINDNYNFHLKINTGGTYTGSFVEILEFSSTPSNYIITNSLETINTSNNSFTFNGTSDYLEIPRHIAPQLAGSDFTIEFWAELSSSVTGPYSTIYVQGIYNNIYNESVGKALHISYYKQGTDIKIQLDFYDKYHVVVVNSEYLDTFSHYAFVFKNSDCSSKLFINGDLISNNIHGGSSSSYNNATGSVVIGKIPDRTDNNHHMFLGKLKHLRVYDSVKYNSNFSINTTEHTVISNPYLPINLDLLIYIPMINKEKVVYHNNNNILSNNNRLYSYQNELYFENGKVITENSQTAPIRFKNNYVGINTSYAQNPLHVTGYGGDITGSYTYFNNFVGLNNLTNLQNIQIYAAGNIYASLLVAASDSRIKTNIEQLVDNEALIKFRQLKPCKYNYIDTVTRTSEKVYGFIAQEVREILPHATSITKECIPNIYKLALYKDTVITFDNEHNLESEGNIKLIKPNNTEIIVPYVIIDTHKINIITSDLSIDEIPSNDLVKDNDGNDSAHNIFVYGTCVDDFHKLNKDAIWTITTASLQEVDKIQQEDRIKINNLVDENTELKDKVSTLETELETLEIELTNALNETLQLEQ